MWQIHYQQIERQGDEWKRIRTLYPDLPLVVAGDFNQDRDGSGWYGTRHGRDLVTRVLADAEPDCLTGKDVVGTAGDHAATESFFKLLQTNVLNRRAWVTREDLTIAIITWIETTYHRRRRQRALGKLTPIGYELLHQQPLEVAA